MGVMANQIAVELLNKLVEKIKSAYKKEDEKQEQNDSNEKGKEQKS